MIGTTNLQAAGFAHAGYAFPLDVLGEREAAALRHRFETLPRLFGRIPKLLHHKLHLLYPWADALVRHPKVLTAVRRQLGPDLLCWSSSIFWKEPRTPHFVSWHQDSTHWALVPFDIVSVWLAISDSKIDNGCLRVIAGSHRGGQLPHSDGSSPSNMLSRGQSVHSDAIDEHEAVDIELEAGQAGVFHGAIVHGSGPNESERPRIGFAIRYITPKVRPTAGPDSAMLVSGDDAFGHFELEPRPRTENGVAERAAHARALERQLSNLFVGATGGQRVKRSVQRWALDQYARALSSPLFNAP